MIKTPCPLAGNAADTKIFLKEVNVQTDQKTVREENEDLRRKLAEVERENIRLWAKVEELERLLTRQLQGVGR